MGRKHALLPLNAVLLACDAWTCSADFTPACAEANTGHAKAEMCKGPGYRMTSLSCSPSALPAMGGNTFLCRSS